MPGFLLHQGALVQCAHAGMAQPTAINPRVRVGGQPVVTQSSTYTIAACGLTGSAPPCATAQWVTAATRVKAGGMPVLMQDSQAICTPTGTPLSVITTQTRVRGM
ncbi:hypothetical protein H6G93_35170 [Nostoc sp. FACHB-973]|nr:hypothetical protein [Nostoc sp. FACHB-973]